MASGHRVLSHPDVLNEIFQHLSPYPEALDALEAGDMPNPTMHMSEKMLVPRRALVNAALACRAFTEPASAVLWAVLQQGFGPLFYALPAFKVVTTLANPELAQYGDLFGDPYTVEYTLQGEITAADWTRWRHCLKRVRYLRYSFNYPRWTVEEPFLSILLRPETQGNPVQTSVLHALMSPSLAIVAINAHIPALFSSHLANDLQMVFQTSKHIRRLHIQSGYRVIHMHLPLAFFRQLRALHITPAVSLALYNHLTNELDALLHLKELSLAIDGDPSSAHISATRSLQDSDIHAHVVRADAAGGFPALRRLSIAGSPFEIRQLLLKINSPVLQDVSILSSQETISEVEAMLQSLSTDRNASSLRKLFIELQTEFSPIIGGAELLYAAFRSVAGSLLSLRSLQDLELLSWNKVLSISDEDVSSMNAAWPHLRRLEIVSNVKDIHRLRDAWSPYAPEIKRPSLTALLLLAERCHSLESLKMDIADVSEDELLTLEARAAASDVTRLQTRFRHLILAQEDHCLHVSIPDVERVARVVRRLFPALEGPGEGGDDWRTRRRPSRHSWTEAQRDTDAFRLMEMLNEV
ncbi:hypothetical protein BN946_scf185016.g18 [Trametes cinnabarina]|uniref:F-box domain-containing protein n=1 Tax=Pycnoporus cinnabarinus TaxID=5643 RepID=A0A060SI73_PYCCI|nr:hypothetical protein BN946_scf185016.g18 [Trametes cinnabarina]